MEGCRHGEVRGGMGRETVRREAAEQSLKGRFAPLGSSAWVIVSGEKLNGR